MFPGLQSEEYVTATGKRGAIHSAYFSGLAPPVFVRLSADPIDNTGLTSILERKAVCGSQHFLFCLVYTENFDRVSYAPLHCKSCHFHDLHYKNILIKRQRKTPIVTMSGTNSSFSLYHLTDPAGWCAVIGAVPVRTLHELCVLYQDYAS